MEAAESGRFTDVPSPFISGGQNAARSFSAGKIISRPNHRLTARSVSRLKRGSYKLKVIGEFDSEAGGLKVFLFCPSCSESEFLFHKPLENFQRFLGAEVTLKHRPRW